MPIKIIQDLAAKALTTYAMHKIGLPWRPITSSLSDIRIGKGLQTRKSRISLRNDSSRGYIWRCAYLDRGLPELSV